MTDGKYEKSLDRQAVLYDFKMRIIDMLDNHPPLPEEGIYDQPVRYFKANLKWTPIIFGWLSIMQSVAAWPDAEDESYRGIQELITFEEGIDLMTPEEFYEANKASIYDALNDIAKQIVSGRVTNISVDDNGNVSTPSEDVETELPPDDPETPIDESLAAKAGGCIAIRTNLQSMMDAVAAWKLAGVSQADATARFEEIYGVFPSVALIYVDYIYLTAPTPTVAPTLLEQLSELLFCRGVSVANFSYYIYNIHPVAADMPELLLFRDCIEQSMMQTWYDAGIEVPSTDYQAWYCTPIVSETFQLDMSTANFVQYTTSGFWKKGHRFRVQVTGTFTDSDQPTITYDGSYKIVSTTGIKTYWPLVFTGSGVPTNPDQDNIPYNPNHVYDFTVDVAITATNGVMVIGKDNGDFALPNTTGILTLTVTDLGYYGA